MLDVSLFRRPAFVGVQLSTFCIGAGMFALFPFLSIYLQDVLGNSPLAERDSASLAHRLHEQAVVLTSSDLYLCMAGIAVTLILLIFWLPTRIYPPRAPT